jgi:hypothetical protein
MYLLMISGSAATGRAQLRESTTSGGRDFESCQMQFSPLRDGHDFQVVPNAILSNCHSERSRIVRLRMIRRSRGTCCRTLRKAEQRFPDLDFG